MIDALEAIVGIFLWVRSLCVLSQTSWRTHPGITTAYLLQLWGVTAILLMNGKNLSTDLFTFYLFGLYSPRVPYLLVLISAALISFSDRRHRFAWFRSRPAAKQEV